MIRIANKNDVSRIAEIQIFAKRTHYRCIFHNDDFSFGELQVVPLANELLEKGSRLCDIFVYEDNFVKGMAYLKKMKAAHGGEALELKELYVDTFFQRQGVGEALLKFAEEKCKEANLPEIILWVLEKNQSARAFYEKYGYKQNNEKCLEEGTTEYLLQYSKKIK